MIVEILISAMNIYIDPQNLSEMTGASVFLLALIILGIFAIAIIRNIKQLP